jgi:hypothetical protein
MEGGQIALFFIHSIYNFTHSVVGVNALCTFDYHLKPIKMKQISAHQVKVFFAKLIASIVIIGGLMGSMAIVELIAGL